MAMRDFFRNDRDDERDRWGRRDEGSRERNDDWRSASPDRDERRFGSQNDYGGGREFGQSEGRRGASPGSREEWRGSRGGREGRGYEQYGDQGGAYGMQGADDQDRGRFGGSGGYGGGQGYGSQEGSYGSGRGGSGGELGVGTRYGGGSSGGQWSGGYGAGGGYSGLPGSQSEGGTLSQRLGGAQGQPGQGQHRGRGPKGYQRSDERIREEVCETLSDDGWLDASNVEVIVREGEVTLSGHVTSRQDKRRAVDLIENLSGVKDVHNNLRVGGESAASTGDTQGTAGAPGGTQQGARTPGNPRH
jgi:hypothetical protein